MHTLVRWFHHVASPPIFDRFAARWSRVFYVAALPVLLIGLWQGLFVVPPEQSQATPSASSTSTCPARG